MSYEVYEEGDSILPMLELPNPCDVRVEIKDDTVVLLVGQRDWCWDRKTGLLKGSGTSLDHPMADGSTPEIPQQEAMEQMSSFKEMEIRATVALDGGTRRACNNENCSKDYRHEGKCDDGTAERQEP